MSRVADFDRSTEGMQRLYDSVSRLCENFFSEAVIADKSQLSDLFKLYDMALTQKATLSAMLCSAAALGTHGAALVDGMPLCSSERRETRTLTKDGASFVAEVSPMPDPELWFEKLLTKKKQELTYAEK